MLGDEARAPGPRLLRSGVGALVDGAEPGGVHVRVALRRGQGGVAEHFLNGAQIRAALQEMGRRRVAQPVGGDVVHPRLGGHPMDHRAHNTRINAPPAVAEKQGLATGLGDQLRAASDQPVVQRLARGRAVGHDALLFSLAEHAHGQSLTVE